jgi:hypothetical protein
MHKENDTRYVNNNKKVADVIKEWENDDWSVIQNKRKVRAPPKYGTKVLTKGKALKAVKEKRTWHLYVGNLDRGTTTNDVCEYLTENEKKLDFSKK